MKIAITVPVVAATTLKISIFSSVNVLLRPSTVKETLISKKVITNAGSIRVNSGLSTLTLNQYTPIRIFENKKTL